MKRQSSSMEIRSRGESEAIRTPLSETDKDAHAAKSGKLKLRTERTESFMKESLFNRQSVTLFQAVKMIQVDRRRQPRLG